MDPEKLPPELVRAMVKKWLKKKKHGEVPGFSETPNGGPIEVTPPPNTAGCGCTHEALTKSASHSMSKCMESGCKKAPEMECVWADGRGRAWFCKKHYDAWKADDKTDDGELPLAIVKERKVPNGVVGEKYGEYPEKKAHVDHRSVFRVASKHLVAKYHGHKRGDGTSVGLFISLPKGLAKRFPTLYPEDNSPSHVTFLYIGEVKGDERQKELIQVLKEVFSDCWEDCVGQLQSLEYFDHEDKDRRVPHMSVAFNRDMEEFRDCVKKGLEEGGFPVQDKFPEFKPHVSLAYMPGMDSQWDGERPNGAWQFDNMEVWGLPDKVHRIPFGKKSARTAANWQAKQAGWWAISPGDNSGLGTPPPVDKGALMNAIPGWDPGDASLYNGDGPADTMDGALDDINLQYWTAWGRPATYEELVAVFDFCTGPMKDETLALSRWFPSFLDWIGLEPTDVALYLETLNAIGWFFRQKGTERFLAENPGSGGGSEDSKLPTVEEALGPLREEIHRVNDLTKKFEGEDAEKKLQEKLDKLKEEWLDAMFPSRKKTAVAERWLAAHG
jgi:2'-5' RNA ligase